MTTHLAPRVSVIIATYNWSSVLRLAIQSVLQQSFHDFELLVVGDNCTDDSEDVVAAFADPRVRWHNLAENSGNQSAPNNAGLDRARGAYVAYLGHDDLWHPDHLGSLVRILDDSMADVAYSLGVMVGPPGNDVRILTGLAKSMQFTHGVFVPPTTVMHRGDLIAAIGGWKDYRTISLPPDTEFLTRAWRAGKRFVGTTELTAFKFPAAWRPGVYRDRPSDEQAEYLRRMAEEPDFRSRELLAVATSYALNRRPPYVDMLPGPDTPPGFIVEEMRMRRGLSALNEATEGPGGPVAVGDHGAFDPYAAQYFRLERWALELHEHVLLKDHYIGSLEAEVRRQHTERAAEQQTIGQMLVEKDSYAKSLEAECQRQQAWAGALSDQIAKKDAYARSLEAEVQRQHTERAAEQQAQREPRERSRGRNRVPYALERGGRQWDAKALRSRLEGHARALAARLRRPTARARKK